MLVVLPALWAYRYVLTPLGHGFARVGRAAGAALGWLYARVLTPVGHALAWLLKGIGIVLAALGGGTYTAVAWLVRYGLVVPALWLYAGVLAPLGRALARLGSVLVTVLQRTLRVLLVLPALGLWPKQHTAVVNLEKSLALGKLPPHDGASSRVGESGMRVPSTS